MNSFIKHQEIENDPQNYHIDCYPQNDEIDNHPQK